jgi:hypothetical protein
MPKTTLSNSEKVTAHIQQLEKPLVEIVELLRQIILSVDAEIGEQIKWNSPSFLLEYV